MDRQQVAEWWQLETTQWVIKKLDAERSYILDAIKTGATLSDDSGLTAQMTARAVGEIAGLEYFLDRKFEEDD